MILSDGMASLMLFLFALKLLENILLVLNVVWIERNSSSEYFFLVCEFLISTCSTVISSQNSVKVLFYSIIALIL